VRVEEGDLVFDRGICEGCLKCAAACPAGARRIYGELMSVDKVLDKVERDAVFHGRSGGGLTLSGGEAGAQPAFSLALLSEARRRHLDTTLETCGHYPFETLAALAGRLDRIIFDLKHWDGDRHREVTGGDLALNAGNLGRLAYEFPDKPLTVRTPVVPGLNDTEEDLREIRRLIPERADIEWELLAYHRLGESKYAFLGREPSWAGAPPDPGRLAALRRAVLGPAASL
jgi:pyruvate formate lyase activating enzyme